MYGCLTTHCIPHFAQFVFVLLSKRCQYNAINIKTWVGHTATVLGCHACDTCSNQCAPLLVGKEGGNEFNRHANSSDDEVKHWTSFTFTPGAVLRYHWPFTAGMAAVLSLPEQFNYYYLHTKIWHIKTSDFQRYVAFHMLRDSLRRAAVGSNILTLTHWGRGF